MLHSANKPVIISCIRRHYRSTLVCTTSDYYRSVCCGYCKRFDLIGKSEELNVVVEIINSTIQPVILDVIISDQKHTMENWNAFNSWRNVCSSFSSSSFLLVFAKFLLSSETFLPPLSCLRVTEKPIEVAGYTQACKLPIVAMLSRSSSLTLSYSFFISFRLRSLPFVKFPPLSFSDTLSFHISARPRKRS